MLVSSLTPWKLSFLEAVASSSYYKAQISDVRKFGGALIAKQDQLDKHVQELNKGTVAAVEATVKELPGWMESLRMESLQQVWDTLQKAAETAVEGCELRATVESLWDVPPELIEELQKDAQVLASSLDIASKLLQHKSPQVSALHSRATKLLPNIQRAANIAKVSLALSKYLPEDVEDALKQKEGQRAPILAGEPTAHALLCETFDGNGFDGIAVTADKMDEAVMSLSREALEDAASKDGTLQEEWPHEDLHLCRTHASVTWRNMVRRA